MTTKRTRRDVSRRQVLIAGGGAAAFGLAGCFGDDPQNGEDDGAGGENGENGENGEEAGTTGPENAEYSVAASMPAVWDFARQVAGEQMEVIDLVPTGEHGHDFDPGPSIVQDIEDADAFIYLRDFSSWQDDAASELEDDDDVVVIEASEGIEFFDSPAEDNDEHFWMDPIECQNGVENIAAGLSEVDPDNEDTYIENAEAFNEELEELNGDFEAIVEEGELNQLVVGTHDSYQWWNRRYGLEIFSPVGTSPDDEASAADVEEIENLIEEFNIGYVLYDVGEPAELAESLANETDTEILPLTPVETQIDGTPNVGDIEMEADWGYIDHFREINLPTVETALQPE